MVFRKSNSDVFIRDLGEDYCGFSISGPKSKELIRNLTDSKIEKLPFMGCGNYDIGLIQTKVGRLSVAGELGYEINCRMGDHIALRRLLLENGSHLVYMNMVSMHFINAFRKSFGIWSAEYTQGYTPGMTGLDRWINWQKSDFIGKKLLILKRQGMDPIRNWLH